MKDVVVIGVAGGTGSGKSTLVKRLQEAFKNDDVATICHDFYYKAHPELTYEERTKLNYDHPDAFDWSLFAKHIEMLKNGESIEQPIYDYITSSRQEKTIHVDPREIIIVEGIMALHDPILRQQMDLKIFVDADADDRLIRVAQRDIVERGRTIEAVMERYQRVLKPMHEQFIETCKRYADVIIPQGGHNNAAINMLVKFIKQELKEKKEALFTKH